MAKYEDKGKTGSDSVMDFVTIGGWSAALGSDHVVEDKETGKTREVRVDPGQSVGEAIERGQWIKK